MKIMCVLESYRRHMDNGRWLFQRGMEICGWKSMASNLPPGDEGLCTNDLSTVPGAKLVIMWPRHEWDYTVRHPCATTPEEGFVNYNKLGPKCVRIAATHDAGSRVQEHRAWFDEWEPDYYLTWYHDKSVLTQMPFLDPSKLIRTYHILNTPSSYYCGQRYDRALFSGARNRFVYPLREKIIKWGLQNVDILPHPGYHMSGSTSYMFLDTLTHYKVSICTASVYNFALKKIFESTAAGCRVITNLPPYDVLPVIDGNLIRLHTWTPQTLRDAIGHAIATYDADAQRKLAWECRAYYDYNRESVRLNSKLSALIKE